MKNGVLRSRGRPGRPSAGASAGAASAGDAPDDGEAASAGDAPDNGEGLSAPSPSVFRPFVRARRVATTVLALVAALLGFAGGGFGARLVGLRFLPRHVALGVRLLLLGDPFTPHGVVAAQRA